jgi:GH24 family phage-related lysozyme (muramidase)
MPVQYQPIPEFQMPNVNILGALAQGQAARQAELQQERLAQQMDLAERAAGYTAARESRQASEAEMNARVKLQELNDKIRAHALSRLSAVPENDQAGYLKTIEEFKDIFPSEYEVLSKRKWDADTRKMVLLTPEQQYQQAKPVYKEYAGEVYKETPQGLIPAPILQPGTEGMPGPRQDLTTSLIKQREGFQPTGKWDVNANRAGYGSDTVTLPDGTVQKVTAGMKVSQEDAERDLQRRIQTEFVPKAAAKVGEENWARLPENTRAALTSIAYNYGTIPSRLVPAVQSGNTEEIAKAIESLAGDNKGVNAGRRMQEANIARGTTMPGSQAVPAFAAAGAPTFLGGPQIQPPINMMAAPPMPPANAMTAPPPTPVQPTQPLTVGTKTVVKGQNDVETTLGKMMAKYNKLDELKKIPSAERGFMENLESYAAGTTFGQEVEKMRATPAQKERNELKSLRRMLLEDIKKATGASSKEMDSNFELKNVLESLSDETQDIDSVRRIVADLSARYGKGRIKAPEEAPVAAPSAPAAAAQRTVLRRGTYNGRPVVQYSDGTTDYAD